MKLSELTQDVLEPMVGSDFTLKFADGQQTTAKLVKVARIMERVTSPHFKRPAFAAYFETPETVFLPQGMYPFFHETLGDEALPIFIVPIERQGGAYRYEAVFT